jgi:O-antigen/teichoic acid export membrane protein
MSRPAELHESSAADRDESESLLARLLRRVPIKGASTVLDQFLVSGASFAASVIIGRLLSPDDLGVYSLALGVVLFIRGIQGELINSPYTVQCHRREPEERAAYTGSVLAFHACLTVVGMAVLAGLALLCGSGRGPAGLPWVFAILVALLPFLLLRECLRQLTMAQLRVGALLGLDATVTVLQVTGLLLLARLGLLTLAAVFTAIAAASAVGCIVWFLTARMPIRLVPGQVKSDWRCNWSFGKWTLAGFLLGSTTPTLVPWFLAATHGKAAVGVLAACTTVVNLAGVYVAGVANFVSPQAARAFSRGGLSELRGVLQRTALLFIVTLSAFCLVVFCTGDLATRLIYGSRYDGTGAILGVLALGMLANSLGMTAGNGLWALHRPELNVAADVCSLTVTLSVVLLLVSPLGVWGAALGQMAGISVGSLVRWLTLWHCVRTMERLDRERIDFTRSANELGGEPLA